MTAGGAVSFGAVILAAGASSRMGQPKLLLPWGESTVVGHLIARWRIVAAQICVVLAAGDRTVADELDRIAFSPGDRILNQEPASGMFSSIRCASAWHEWRPDLTHFAIVLGDQPQIDPVTTLAPLFALAAKHPEHICQPSHAGAPKHPVVLPRAIFSHLAQTAAATLKDVLRQAPVCLSPIDDARLAVDLDYPADYERARALWPTG